jgi:hypothetical protein
MTMKIGVLLKKCLCGHSSSVHIYGKPELMTASSTAATAAVTTSSASKTPLSEIDLRCVCNLACAVSGAASCHLPHTLGACSVSSWHSISPWFMMVDGA